ncbi:MAG: glycosyltransferase family 2 protein [Candidatus Obscuribacterales bacterium]|nr:glycosyltransferase family 2 protein [Candidatus Obscuribacterales bacterium]
MTSTAADYTLSIVIPMYNEEQGALECVKQVKAILDKMQCKQEIIFVNDGSHDRTLEILVEQKEKDASIRVIDLSRNFGHQAAITAGLDHATGDAVVVIDGDLQDPPELFPTMVAKWQEGYEIVHARRKKRLGISAFADLRAKVFYRLMKNISTIDIPVDVGDFRLISARVAADLKAMREQHRYVRGLATWVGYKQTIVEYERHKRYAGVPQYTLGKLINLCLAGITSFSKTPLRLGIYLGMLCVVAGLSLGAVTIIFPAKLVAWSPAVMTIYFVGGLQLVCIGLLGEYLYLVLEQTRNRPLYLIRKEY